MISENVAQNPQKEKKRLKIGQRVSGAHGELKKNEEGGIKWKGIFVSMGILLWS